MRESDGAISGTNDSPAVVCELNKLSTPVGCQPNLRVLTHTQPNPTGPDHPDSVGHTAAVLIGMRQAVTTSVYPIDVFIDH